MSNLDAADVAALIASGAFLMLVIVLAVPILRLRRTVDKTTEILRVVATNTGPILEKANTTVENVNATLGQVQVSLDGVNLQLARVDTITQHVQHVTANVANLSTVVAAAASNPLVKVAAFTYGVRRHFWTLAARDHGGRRWPRKYGTNCTMPALTNSRFGSSIAGSGALGTTVCPFASKWARNRRLISAVLIGLLPRTPGRRRAACLR